MSDFSNSGTLGKNRRQRPDHANDPGYAGQCEINGVPYWISAWLKDGKDGGKFFSLSFKPKSEPVRTGAQPATAAEEGIPF